MKPLVSVIIPVYNSREYLAEAIQSVLDQSLESVEIIAVNDGSTDGSLDVLESFGDRIRIISQKNSGQGAARNRALALASGDFVYFMDSDDWIDRNTLESCVARCLKDNLDFVFFDAVSFGAEYDKTASWFDYHRAGSYPQVIQGCIAMKDMLGRGLYRCSVCMCLYRREFITKNGIYFPEGILHEDEFFSAAAYLKAGRIAGIAEEFYHRRLRGNSVMTRTFSERNAEGYLTTLKLCEELGDTIQEKDAVRLLTKSFVTSLMHNSWNLPLRYRTKIAWTIVTRYPHACTAKPYLALLFKKYLR